MVLDKAVVSRGAILRVRGSVRNGLPCGTGREGADGKCLPLFISHHIELCCIRSDSPVQSLVRVNIATIKEECRSRGVNIDLKLV